MRVTRALALGALLGLARESSANADDVVRACIDASTAGQTLRQQGRLLGARDRMIECARDACPAVVRSHCARWLAEVDERTPTIVVRAQDEAGKDLVDARMFVDGKPSRLDGRAVPLDPGEHVVAVEAGTRRKEERVLLVEGEASRLVLLRVAPALPAGSREAPSARESTRVPVGAWILGGAGLAALGVATYFGVAANGQLQDLRSCSPHCSSAQTQPGRTDAVAFDALLVGGGAAVGVALVWALFFPSTTGVDLQPIPHGALTSLTLRY
jgi:hypothetical protein